MPHNTIVATGNSDAFSRTFAWSYPVSPPPQTLSMQKKVYEFFIF